MSIRTRKADLSAYWGKVNGITSVTPSGFKDHWGEFIDTVAAGKHIVIVRHRAARNPESVTPVAVAIPERAWIRHTRKHGEPARVEVFNTVQARRDSTKLWDRLGANEVHVKIRRRRDTPIVFVPLAWYQNVTGKNVTEITSGGA